MDYKILEKPLMNLQESTEDYGDVCRNDDSNLVINVQILNIFWNFDSPSFKI